MSKALYNLFKVNQDWSINSLTSQRIDSNGYGKQAVSQYWTLDNATFASDLALALASTPTIERRATSSLYYGSVEMETAFTNQELTTCYLSIYDMKPRFHMPGAAYRPAAMWELGIQYETGEGQTIDSYLDVYQKPFRSEFFTNFYNVLNVQRVELSPGSTHKHTVRYHLNTKILGFKLEPFVYLKNYTNFQMYVVSGTPVNDSTVLTNVSTSTVALDVVRKLVYNFTLSNQARTQIVNTSSLPTITAANVITDTTIIPDAEA